MHVDILIVTAMAYTLKSRFTTGQAFLEEGVKISSGSPDAQTILLPRILFASAKILVAMKKYGEAIGQLTRVSLSPLWLFHYLHFIHICFIKKAEQMLKRSDGSGALLAEIYLFIGRVSTLS